MPKARQILGGLLVAAAVATAGGTAYHNDLSRPTPLAFSNNEMLSGLWQKYVRTYIEPGNGRVIDRQQNDLTTSEGQGYAMLRAVWQDDQPTFDRVWAFTRSALKRPDDHLFAWKFGQRSDGSYGVLTDRGGQNTASDADTDIALSLVMAYGRWQKPAYLEQAKPVISDIWTKEVVQVDGQPVLAADDLEKASTEVVVNPSYLAPYAYRAFARVDTAHDWTALVQSSYDLIDRVLEAPLDRATSAALPPNWVRLDTHSGDFLPLAGALTTDFGYDALRLAWRLALDDRWNREPRAARTLQRLDLLRTQWRSTGKLAATYAHDGGSPAGYESAAMYGGSMGFFSVVDRQDEGRVYATKLAALYNPDTQSWRTTLSYYDDNWAWFGMAMHQGALPDLTDGVKQ